MIKNIKKEFKYFYWLLKNRYFQVSFYFDIFYSVILFHIPFIPFDFKLLYLSPRAIPFLKNKYFKFLFNLNFSNVIKSQLNILEGEEKLCLNKLNKLCWLIASFSKDHELLDLLINFLKNLDYENINIFTNRNKLNESFYRLGDFSSSDKLSLFLRDRQNKLLERKAGFHDDEFHFNSIGHMCFFAYMLQAFECDFLNKDLSNFSFVYFEKKLKNRLFFNILFDYGKSLGISISESKEKKSEKFDNEILIWPDQKRPDFGVLVHQEFYKLAEKIESLDKNYFLDAAGRYIKIAKELLDSRFNSKYKFFVALHFRSAFDDRTIRNTSLESARFVCELINKEGGQCFLIGANNFLSRNLKNFAFDIKNICNNQYEYELLQLYLWAYSKFMVGSSSGGTLPASLFGTLTLFLDFHPSGLFHPPNLKDIFVPKRVFSRPLGRFLTWQESISYKHRFSQTENPIYANNYGYKVLPAHKDSVEKAFNYAMEMCVYKLQINNNTDLKSRIYYKAD